MSEGGLIFISRKARPIRLQRVSLVNSIEQNIQIIQVEVGMI